MSETDHVVAITGGASGIGAATAAHLREKGWKVAILDLETRALAQARLTYEGQTSVAFRALDVTDEDAVETAIGEIELMLGPITGVVNCAGIAADRHVLDTPVALFRKILDVNVIGTFLVGRAAARRMRTRNGGAIVNIASISGLRGSKGRVAYGASKGAVVTLTQVMANDLAADGIRVNAIAPGPVETPMVEAVHSDADRALYHRFVPMNRYAAPREIATAIAFLLDGGQSGFVTGEILAVDGGFRGAGLIVRD